MNNVYFRAAIVSLTIITSAASADAQRMADVRGFHLGGALNATSIKFDETAFSDDDRDSGFGINLHAGYNFTRNLGVLLNVTGASISADDADDYSVAHVDLLGRASFPGRSAMVPYVELGISGVGASYEPELADKVELEGAGVTFGAGLNYFFTRRAALDLGFRFTTGEIDDGEIAGRDIDTGDGVGFNTTRLNLGIAFYP